jgi:hypothetical protein
MKALLYVTLACALLAGAGCAYHETVVEKPVPSTAAVVVHEPAPPPAAVVVPDD